MLMGGAVWAQDPSIETLQRQVADLQAQLDELKSQRSAPPAAEVDAVVARVLADAEQRSRFLQTTGFTAGYTGSAFVIQSEDGNFVLRPGFQWQLRHMSSFQDTDDGWESDSGFELRRVKFQVDGNVISKKLTYFLLWTSGVNDGNLRLEHAWVKYALSPQWSIRAGQIGHPLFHEQAVSSRRQLAVDRSLANSAITGTNEAQTQAATLIYTDGPLSAEFGVTDGFISSNTNFQDTAAGQWGGFARVDYVLAGERKQYIDFTAMGNQQDLLVIGGGLDVTGQDDDSNTTAYRHTIDVQFENTAGLSLYAAYLGNYVDAHSDGDAYNWGLVAQAGYMIDQRWEIFGRYGLTMLDVPVTSGGESEDTFHEFTTGVNYYFRSHSAKLTIDVTWLPDGSPSNQSGIGILGGLGEQFIVRSQFQLLI